MADSRGWDRVVFINLDERSDRLAEFRDVVTRSGLLRDTEVVRFAAESPRTCVPPTWYRQGQTRREPNWACRMSHLRV
jgi:hypothetical protein